MNVNKSLFIQIKSHSGALIQSTRASRLEKNTIKFTYSNGAPCANVLCLDNACPDLNGPELVYIAQNDLHSCFKCQCVAFVS